MTARSNRPQTAAAAVFGAVLVGIVAGTAFNAAVPPPPDGIATMLPSDVPGICQGVLLLATDAGAPLDATLAEACADIPPLATDADATRCERFAAAIEAVQDARRHIQFAYVDSPAREHALVAAEDLHRELGSVRALRCLVIPEWPAFEPPIIAGGIEVTPAQMDARAKPPGR